GRGFIGSYNTSYPPVISNCFWSSESSGQTGSGAPSGVTDKTVAEMKTLSTYTNAGWDFDGSTGGDDYFWAMDDSKNGGYPYLWWQSFPYNVTFTDGSSYSGSPIAGETNQPFGRFSLLADHSGADLVGVWIELTGTRTGVSNLKFWYSDDNSFDSSSDFQLSATVSSDPGEGETISFINFSQDIGTGNAYFFLTCDLAADATGLLRGKIVGNQDVFLKKASLNSTIDNAYLSADDIPLPVTLSSFSGALINSLPTLYWTTQSETDNLGWNVYRSNLANGWEMNDYLQLNGDLIPGMGTTSVPTDYSFIDDQTIAEGTYYYWLESVSFSNELASFGPVEIRIDATMLPDLPTQSFLNCNYPNPFNPVTTIYFGIKEKEEGILTILNIKGQKIISKKFQKGYHTYVWNASCQASGVYFFRLQTASCNHIRKAILMK
ncbi:MAG TPA: T9SS type A sorting domain-containing protein, partial [Candidatus Cloacimonadota bacterium]|nr:T9SS type A sorting domain-containing protein [Candidatus Cloacimonadota bacterium]